MKRAGLFLTVALCALGRSAACDDMISSSLASVRDCLVLQDFSEAVARAKALEQSYPGDLAVRKIKIEALSAAGEEEGMIASWQSLEALNHEAAYERQVLETLCWGVLSPAARSTLPSTQMISLMAVAYTQDANALTPLMRALQGSNIPLRAMAIHWVPRYRDAPLCEALLHLLKEETVWSLRLEVIRALGAMQLKQALEPLKALVADMQTPLEERRLATIAIASILDDIDIVELQELVASKRAGLRELAAVLLTYHDKSQYLECLAPLLTDMRAEVQMSALNALASFPKAWPNEGDVEAKVRLLLESPQWEVALTAAWALARRHDDEALLILKEAAKSPLQERALLAASMLSSLGAYSFAATQEVAKENSDLFVRATLAMGWMGQRVALQEAATCLKAVLATEERLQLKRGKNPVFEFLAPSEVFLAAHIPNYPEVVNQKTRLELVNRLALIQDPESIALARAFLAQKTAGVAGMAGELILAEGEEGMIPLVSELLDDPDKKIRLQAALLLGLWGRDVAAIKTLEEMYGESDKEARVQILAILGEIGDTSCLDFLLKVLQDPFRTTRVIAASSILRILHG